MNEDVTIWLTIEDAEACQYVYLSAISSYELKTKQNSLRIYRNRSIYIENILTG